MENINLVKISLEETASHSAWPSRLLDIDHFPIKHKSSAEIHREFGDEKWGKLLNMLKNKPSLSLADIEAAEQNLERQIPCYDNSIGFYLVKAKYAQIGLLKIYEKILAAHAYGASGLVELGAGYGSKIIRLSNTVSMKKLPLYAAEYTQAGCELIRLISKKEKKNIQIGWCDFEELDLVGLDIPENAIIFTSYSLHYVPELKEQFVKFLSQFKPKLVVHFEPCYEYFNRRSLHGLMCRRYMDLNGYTKNIASAIHAGCKKIGAEIKIQENVFGYNPFLPISIIEWSPSN